MIAASRCAPLAHAMHPGRSPRTRSARVNDGYCHRFAVVLAAAAVAALLASQIAASAATAIDTGGSSLRAAGKIDREIRRSRRYRARKVRR